MRTFNSILSIAHQYIPHWPAHAPLDLYTSTVSSSGTWFSQNSAAEKLSEQLAKSPLWGLQCCLGSICNVLTFCIFIFVISWRGFLSSSEHHCSQGNLYPWLCTAGAWTEQTYWLTKYKWAFKKVYITFVNIEATKTWVHKDKGFRSRLILKLGWSSTKGTRTREQTAFLLLLSFTHLVWLYT